MRKMAKEYQVSEKTIRRIVKKDLYMCTFAIQKRQALTRLQKEKRKFRATKILDEITTQSLGKNTPKNVACHWWQCSREVEGCNKK